MKETQEIPATYEEAYAELQQIVSDLQQETVRIDDLARYIERARLLVRLCRERLRQIEEQLREEDEPFNP